MQQELRAISLIALTASSLAGCATADSGALADRAVARDMITGECTAITQHSGRDEMSAWYSFVATKPGNYCLTENIVQAKRTGPLGSPETSDAVAFIRVAASDVTIDFNKHSIENKAPSGASALSLTRPMNPSLNEGLLSLDPFRVTVRSGTIRSPFAMGKGVRFIGRGVPARPNYLDTKHLIESMTIYAGGAGVEIKGRSNTIRNSRIVIDGPTGIDSWGPNMVIENNVIEIRPRRSDDWIPWPTGLTAPDTAIRLLDADGTIIRNNVIRFHPDFGGKPHPAAIGLTLSRDVVIEGNRFIGFDAIVTKDAGSSVIDRDNRLIGSGQ